MSLTVLSQIEERLDQLSFAVQLCLLEHIAQGLREQLMTHNTCTHQRQAMAAVPDIQRELRQIEEEFAPAIPDGLDHP